MAPTTAQPQPLTKTPLRIRNSPANAVDPGTASAITPVTISTVASAGRPRAMPPTRSSEPVPVRSSTMPAIMNSVAESRPWLTICSSAPFQPETLVANTPSTINPSWARLE